MAHQRQIGDLVQEQRAAVGLFEATDAQLLGAGISARFGAEQLRLQELIGQPACIDLHEWPALAARVGLHDLREALFARAIGPGDQHGRLRGRDLGGQGDHLVHGRAGVDQPAQVVTVRQVGPRAVGLRAQPQIFTRKLTESQQVFDRGHEFVVVPGLGDVVTGALSDQAHGGLQRLERGHQQHG